MLSLWLMAMLDSVKCVVCTCNVYVAQLVARTYITIVLTHTYMYGKSDSSIGHILLQHSANEKLSILTEHNCATCTIHVSRA